jgi:2-iminobutanoate/2-iminopropanoate deaminase
MTLLEIKRFPSDLPFPFSKAVEAGGFLFLSGQVSMSETGEPLHGDVTIQTRNIMAGIERTLLACDSGLDAIVKVTAWLSDMKHFAAFNQEYRTFFPHGFPSRSVVSCNLAFGLDVEIEVQALKKTH